MKKMVLAFSILFIIPFDSFSQQNFWDKKNFPSFYDGNICAIAALNDLVFISTYTSFGYSGGVSRIVKSTNGGNSWFNVTPLPTYYAYSILISSNGYIFAIGNNDILYHSTDEGLSWVVNSGVHFGNGPKIIQASNGFIFISSHQGIYRSTDFGETWEPKNNGLSLGSILGAHLTVNDSGLLIVATSAGLFKSTNYGNNWTNIPKPINTLEIQPNNVALNSDGHIFVSLYLMNSYPSDSLYKSTNNGQSWVRIRSGGQNILCIDKSSEAIIINNGGEQKYSFSTDDGVTWNDVQIEGYLYGGFVCNANSYFIGIDNLGIFKATSLIGPWSFIGNNFPGGKSSVTSILQTNEGTFIVASDTFGVYRSTDEGISFSEIISPFPSSASKLCSTLNGKIFLASSSVALSTNDGITWTWQGSSGGPLYDLTALSLCADYNLIFTGGIASSGAEIDRSTNSGVDWQEVLKIQSFNDVNFVTNLDIKNGVVFATTKKSTMYPISTSYRLKKSTDNGITWEDINVTLSPFPNFKQITSVSSGEMYAATSAGIMFSSNDNGLTWSLVTGSVPTSNINCIISGPNDELFVGTGGLGIYKSIDQGQTWEQLNSGLDNLEVNTLYLDKNNFLWAGSESGVFQSNSAIVNVQEDIISNPKNFQLYQNYPNPFNPSTIISWQSPIGSWQTLKVYDVLGNEVATLVDEYRNTGNYSVEFDGSNLPSGIYFYQLKAGSYVETKKMILIK